MATILLLCVIYIRVSSDEQREEGASLEAQIENAKRKAKEMGIEAEFTVFKDEGVSATKVPLHRRQGMMECLDFIKNHKPDYLFVWRRDRLARRIEEQMYILKTVQKDTKIIFFGSGEPPIGTKGFGVLQETMLGGIAEYESQMIRQRILDTRRNIVLSGKWIIGTPPYGYVYDYDLEKYKIVPDEAQVVKDMFELYTEHNMGSHRITKLLNSKGISSRSGRLWDRNTVACMLKNSFYCSYPKISYIENNGDDEQRVIIREHSDRVPAIISEQQFETAQAIFQSRRNHGIAPRKFCTSFLLSGLLFCSKCGSKFTSGSWSQKSKSAKESGVSKRYDIYYCTSERKGGDCYSRVKKEHIESAVIAGICKELNALDMDLVLEEAKSQLENLNNQLISTVTSLKKEVERLNTKLRKNQEDLEEADNPKMKKHFKSRLEELLNMIDLKVKNLSDTEKELSRIKKIQMDTVAACMKMTNWEELFLNSSHDEKRAMIVDIVDRIEYNSTNYEANVTLKLGDHMINNRDLCLTGGWRNIKDHGLVNRTFTAMIAYL